MDDLISRRAAIETAVSYIEEWNGAQSKFHRNRITERFLNLPSAQPEIIRCKDCKYKYVHRFPPKYEERNCCEVHDLVVDDANFCSWAERRKDE